MTINETKLTSDALALAWDNEELDDEASDEANTHGSHHSTPPWDQVKLQHC